MGPLDNLSAGKEIAAGVASAKENLNLLDLSVEVTNPKAQALRERNVLGEAGHGVGSMFTASGRPGGGHFDGGQIASNTPEFLGFAVATKLYNNEGRPTDMFKKENLYLRNNKIIAPAGLLYGLASAYAPSAPLDSQFIRGGNRTVEVGGKLLTDWPSAIVDKSLLTMGLDHDFDRGVAKTGMLALFGAWGFGKVFNVMYGREKNGENLGKDEKGLLSKTPRENFQKKIESGGTISELLGFLETEDASVKKPRSKFNLLRILPFGKNKNIGKLAIVMGVSGSAQIWKNVIGDKTFASSDFQSTVDSLSSGSPLDIGRTFLEDLQRFADKQDLQGLKKTKLEERVTESKAILWAASSIFTRKRGLSDVKKSDERGASLNLISGGKQGTRKIKGVDKPFLKSIRSEGEMVPALQDGVSFKALVQKSDDVGSYVSETITYKIVDNAVNVKIGATDVGTLVDMT